MRKVVPFLETLRPWTQVRDDVPPEMRRTDRKLLHLCDDPFYNEVAAAVPTLPPWEQVLGELELMQSCFGGDGADGDELSHSLLAQRLMSDSSSTEIGQEEMPEKALRRRQDEEFDKSRKIVHRWFHGGRPRYHDVCRLWNAFHSGRYGTWDPEGAAYTARDICIPATGADRSLFHVEKEWERVLNDSRQAQILADGDEYRAVLWWSSAASNPLSTHHPQPRLFKAPDGAAPLRTVSADTSADRARRTAVEFGWTIVEDGSEPIGVLPNWSFAESLAHLRRGWAPRWSLVKCSNIGMAAKCGSAVRPAVVLGRPGHQIQVCLRCWNIGPFIAWAGREATPESEALAARTSASDSKYELASGRVPAYRLLFNNRTTPSKVRLDISTAQRIKFELADIPNWIYNRAGATRPTITHKEV